MTTQTLTATNFNSCSLPISSKFHQLLAKHIDMPSEHDELSITINFRDTSYSAEDGGFHPVEVGLQKQASQQWDILYITDFAYFGNVYPELGRSVDFDIANQMAFFTGIGWQEIDSYGVNDFYELWESNFLTYVEMDAFDEIKVTNN